MKGLQIFNSPQFGEIRTVVSSDGQPLFCLADLCKSLDLESRHVVGRLERGSVVAAPLQTRGGVQQANFVNEDGLYDVILDSRKPEARAFRKWIASEVLPSIRRTGAYAVAIPGESQEQMIARALITAQQTMERQEKEIALLRQLNSEKERTIELQKLVIEGRPSTPSTRTYTTTQIAEELGMRTRDLNRQLHALGVQGHEGKRWPIADKYARNGFRTKVAYSYRYANADLTSMREEWTEKGREFILSLFNVAK